MFLTLLLAAPAHALDVRWWGVGPTVGTMAVPGDYPSALPANAKSDGDPLVEKVRGDISFGAQGVLYPDKQNRLGARGLIGLGFGSGWSSAGLTLEYDRALINTDGFQLLAGVGIGAATQKFGGDEDAPEGRLVVNSFPVRAQITPLLRDKTRAYQVSLYGTWHIVADQTYYEDANADGLRGADLATVPGAFYAGLGLEATVFFGDFRSQKREGDGGGGGGRGGRD